MSMESDAKEAAILRMLEIYPQYRATDEFIDALVAIADGHSLQAVRLACDRFRTGQVPGHNNAYVLNGAQFAEQCALFDRAYSDVKVKLFNGLLESDWGHGRVDLRGLTAKQQDRIIDWHDITPDGRNMALMTLEEKVEAVEAPQLEGPKSTLRPRLQRMTDK